MKDFVNSIMHNDRVWNSVRIDGVEKEQFCYQETNIYFLYPHGFVMFRDISPIMKEVHVCMLKCKNTREIVENCLETMRNKGVKKFLAPIGDWNKSALKLSIACGFKEEGRITNAFLRDGKSHSMILMGGL